MNRTLSLLWALALLLLAGLAQAADSCYPTEITAPPLRSQTLVVFDETSAHDPTAWRDFRAATLGLATQPGQRLVMLRFAGIAPGQLLSRDLDERIEDPITHPDQVAELRIGPFKRSQACVRQRQSNAQAAVQARLAQWAARPSDQLARSEIVHFVRQVLLDFAQPGLPTRVLVYSDGVQNGSGMVFYKAGRPRDIDPQLEARLLPPGSQPASPAAPSPAPVAVYWWGLLVAMPPPATAASAPARQAGYASAQMLEHYTRFWQQALTTWGASKVQIGPTLSNPDFLLPASGRPKPAG